MDYTEAAEFLKRRDNYLILTHKRPDGDTVGSAAGLCELLRALGKTAWMLPSLDVTREFAGYWEGRAAPADFRPETVVSVDVASRSLLPPNAARWRNRVDLALDHHPSQEFFAAETCLEADKAACGELLWKICGCLGVMTPEIAAALYVAVSTDTGCFVYGNTTAHTHRVAAALIEEGIPYRALNKRHFRTKSLARLRVESLITQSILLYREGTVAVACVPREMLAEAGATEDDMTDIAAFAGQIEGVRHAATIREHEGGECRISLRTIPELLNANDVCAKLGGGGHAAAAGCVVRGTLDEAREALLAAIDEVLGCRTESSL